MADEAFALSPISARAAAPSEADYDAIREAFMETSRGRWFLSEYAKRNRNADTRMVLDAVARIEETIAAQRQPPPPDNRLPDALAAIKAAVERAEGKAALAFDGSQLEQNLAPIRKGTRIIKEISWRWREIGADGRICDLIDSQVAAIEAGCGKIASHDPRTALREAFEEIRAEIEAFRETSAGAAAPPEVEAKTVVVPFPPPAEQVRATARTEAPIVNAPEPPVEAAAPASEVAVAADAAADAQDEAVLELVAAEMAAPDDSMSDVSDDFPIVEPEDTHITPPPPSPEPVTAARAAEPKIETRIETRIEPRLEPRTEPRLVSSMAPPIAPPAPVQPARKGVFAPVDEPLIRPMPAPEPSLGAMIMANGILPKQEPASDPLAPIRRMSQAEKIAFFS